MADIQAEGLRAAGELIDRVLRSEPDAADATPRSEPTGSYAALVDAWTELLRRTVDGLAPPGGPGSVTVDLESGGVGPQVRLVVGGATGSSGAGAEIWLQNGTSADVGPLALHCGPLRDSDGKLLKGGAVHFDPDEVPLLPARSSRAVTVSLEPKQRLRSGTYRATIQARGAPGLWLPLEVVVAPS